MRSVNLQTFPAPLSAVCLGTARFGGEYDEKRSFDLLDRYYDMGGRFLDTANVYGRWAGRGLNESELTVGKWLKIRKIDDMVITSKCVHWLPEAPSVSRVNRREAMRDLDDSRKSLGMDEIIAIDTFNDSVFHFSFSFSYEFKALSASVIDVAVQFEPGIICAPAAICAVLRYNWLLTVKYLPLAIKPSAIISSSGAVRPST